MARLFLLLLLLQHTTFSYVASNEDTSESEIDSGTKLYMKKLHGTVNEAGECTKSTLSGTDANDNVDPSLKNCAAQPTGLSDDQEIWLKSLGAEIHLSDFSDMSPVVRKEVRQYSEDEWNDVVEAITAMQNTMVGNTSEYGIFVILHQHDVGPAGTRAGPGSWTWHREYLTRFEKAMQRHVPGVSLPYWDVSLDAYLPYFNSSVFWSNDLLGACGSGVPYDDGTDSSRDGIDMYAEVIDGRFAYWRVNEPCATSLASSTYGRFSTKYSTRTCNVEYVQTFNDAELEYVLNRHRTFADFSYDLCLLTDHDGLHISVGGTSEYPWDKSCAVVDPVMWFMHAYLDYLWEMFRQKAQITDLETDYMADVHVLECHQYNAEMTPFNELKNSDGLKKMYTKFHYVYEESPRFCESNIDCAASASEGESNPKYLWCDLTAKRCKSKVKAGTTCQNLVGDACESGSHCSQKTKICEREMGDDEKAT